MNPSNLPRDSAKPFRPSQPDTGLLSESDLLPPVAATASAAVPHSLNQTLVDFDFHHIHGIETTPAPRGSLSGFGQQENPWSISHDSNTLSGLSNPNSNNSESTSPALHHLSLLLHRSAVSPSAPTPHVSTSLPFPPPARAFFDDPLLRPSPIPMTVSSFSSLTANLSSSSAVGGTIHTLDSESLTRADSLGWSFRPSPRPLAAPTLEASLLQQLVSASKLAAAFNQNYGYPSNGVGIHADNHADVQQFFPPLGPNSDREPPTASPRLPVPTFATNGLSVSQPSDFDKQLEIPLRYPLPMMGLARKLSDSSTSSITRFDSKRQVTPQPQPQGSSTLALSEFLLSSASLGFRYSAANANPLDPIPPLRYSSGVDGTAPVPTLNSTNSENAQYLCSPPPPSSPGLFSTLPAITAPTATSLSSFANGSTHALTSSQSLALPPNPQWPAASSLNSNSQSELFRQFLASPPFPVSFDDGSTTIIDRRSGFGDQPVANLTLAQDPKLIFDRLTEAAAATNNVNNAKKLSYQAPTRLYGSQSGLSTDRTFGDSSGTVPLPTVPNLTQPYVHVSACRPSPLSTEPLTSDLLRPLSPPHARTLIQSALSTWPLSSGRNFLLPTAVASAVPGATSFPGPLAEPPLESRLVLSALAQTRPLAVSSSFASNLSPISEPELTRLRATAPAASASASLSRSVAQQPLPHRRSSVPSSTGRTGDLSCTPRKRGADGVSAQGAWARALHGKAAGAASTRKVVASKSRKLHSDSSPLHGPVDSPDLPRLDRADGPNPKAHCSSDPTAEYASNNGVPSDSDTGEDSMMHTASDGLLPASNGDFGSGPAAMPSHEDLKVGRKVLAGTGTELKEWIACCWPDCTRIFDSNLALRRHVMRHRSKILASFSCSECGKNFADSTGLKRHARIHNGEKPYQCSICYRTFADGSNSRRHERSHLKKGGASASIDGAGADGPSKSTEGCGRKKKQGDGDH